MMRNRLVVLGIALCCAAAVSASAVDNIRAVQTKLKEGGFYSGEVDGAYSAQLSAALTRYQIRNGLPITGQLDTETSKALGAEPAVSTPSATDPARTSETWRQLRKSDEKFAKSLDAQGRAAAGPTTMKSAATGEPPPEAAPPAQGPTVAAIPPTQSEPDRANPDVERLRDYIGAFILAGLDPQVGAETNFFADRVRYYNDGLKDREAIRRDLQRYDARWPQRKFWLAGDVVVKPEKNGRLRVTFPLGFELHNGGKKSAGKVEKTIVLEPAGDDWQIISVNER